MNGCSKIVNAIPEHSIPLRLGFGMAFADLYDREALRALDNVFLTFLGDADSALRDRLCAARTAPERIALK